MKSRTRTTQPSNAAASAANFLHKRDFLVMRLADREYAIDLEKVQELCDFSKVAPLAGAPVPVAGFLTLRGRRTTVIDMHALLGRGRAQGGRLTDVIVLECGGLATGLAVDCVIDVVMLAASQVTPAASADNPGLIGEAALGQRTIVLLDVDKLMADYRPGTIRHLDA